MDAAGAAINNEAFAIMEPSSYGSRCVLAICPKEGNNIHSEIQMAGKERIEETELTASRKPERFQVVGVKILDDVYPLVRGKAASGTPRHAHLHG